MTTQRRSHAADAVDERHSEYSNTEGRQRPAERYQRSAETYQRPGDEHQRPGETYRAEAGPAQVTVGDRIAGSAPSALVLLGAIWLVISRLVFDYTAAGAGTGGTSNGVVIGIAVGIIAIARMVTNTSNPALSLVNVVLGGWMIASPWVFGYVHWGAGSGSTWSDVIVGAVIALAALASWSAGSMRRSVIGRPAMSGR